MNVLLKVVNKTQEHKEYADFVLCGDNVNFSLKPRHTSRDKENRQLNMFNTMAVKSRVPYSPGGVPGRPEHTDTDIQHISAYMPSRNDDITLRSDFR